MYSRGLGWKPAVKRVESHKRRILHKLREFSSSQLRLLMLVLLQTLGGHGGLLLLLLL
jgi:hypothetical protein